MVMFLGTSSEYFCVRLRGPQADLTQFAVSLAFMPSTTAAEPADGDYKTAAWIGGEAAWKPPGQWGQSYAPGEYLAYARIQAAPEDVRIPAGRLRIGDVR